MSDANTLYQELLAGTLSAEQKAVFAARLRDDEAFAATLDADEDELLLVSRLLWAEQGGHDSCAPRFDPERANAAARQGVMAQRRGRTRVVVLAGAALAAAVVAFLVLRPTGSEPVAPEHQARGGEAKVGVAVDWTIDDEPLLSKGVIAADAKVFAEFTNPGGAYTHLKLGAVDADGQWHELRPAAPIGAVGVDDPVTPAGPFVLPAGTVKLCGVFSNGTATEGERDCTEHLRLQ